MPDSPLTLVYVTSAAHSGSTLLDLLISSHSRVTSVGEALRFPRGRAATCSCDAETIWECDYWTRIRECFEPTAGIPLADCPVVDGAVEEFGRCNRALFEAVRSVTGKSVIVDSSKSLPRLQLLLTSFGSDCVPIHLVRRPEGVAWSLLRKGRSWMRTAWNHGRREVLTERLLARRRHLIVRYEDLAARPAGVLATVMRGIGLSFESQQLAWAGRERHNCGGNRMRRTKDSSIRPDLAWQTGMTEWQKRAVALVALAGRVSLRLRPEPARIGASPPPVRPPLATALPEEP